VQGHIQNPPADESYPYNPGDVYQRSKCEAEKLALEYYRDRRLAVTVIRPAGIYGPGDMRWLKMFRAIARRRFAMLGGGRTFIHLVYVSDLVDGFRLAADSPRAVGQVYTIGGDGYVTLSELADRIAKAAGVRPPWLRIPAKPVRILSGVCEDVCRALHVEPPIFRRRVDLFVKNRAFDITKARTELGFSPRVSLEEGVGLTMDWYREQGLL
jgi:nucleoside-diphosphate-sugar epimerase